MKRQKKIRITIVNKALLKLQLVVALILFLLPSLSVGQDHAAYKAVLIDSTTKQPIPYATIKVLNKAGGTYANQDGIFAISVSSKDSLLVTSIGYLQRIVISIRMKDTIYLVPAVHELIPVVVAKRKFVKTETLGLKNIPHTNRWGPTSLGEEFAQRIHFLLDKNEYYHIKNISVSAIGFNPNRVVMLHVYAADDKGLPGKELLSKKCILTKADFIKNKIQINIRAENLVLDDKFVFIGFEWFGKTERNNHEEETILFTTNALADTLTFSRTLHRQPYKWFPAPIINGKLLNTIFSIQVDRLIDQTK